MQLRSINNQILVAGMSLVPISEERAWAECVPESRTLNFRKYYVSYTKMLTLSTVSFLNGNPYTIGRFDQTIAEEIVNGRETAAARRGDLTELGLIDTKFINGKSQIVIPTEHFLECAKKLVSARYMNAGHFCSEMRRVGFDEKMLLPINKIS